jgi:type I restriction enzyme M protein
MKMAKLGDICTLSKGKTITRATAIEGDVPVIGGGLGPTYYHNLANSQPPVITISASGANAGFVNYWNVPIWASDCTTIVEKPSAPASINYIYKYLQSRQEFINKELRRGSAQPHVYPSDIADLEIIIPSLEIQREVVEKLDKAFAAIDLLEKNLELGNEKVNQLLQSIQGKALTVFNEDWESSKIGDLGKWVTGSTPSTAKKEFWGDEVPFVTPADLGTSGELGEIARRISKLGSEQVRIISAPAVLLVCIGATLGKVAWTNRTVTTNQQINTLQVDVNKSNTKFLMYLLSSPHIQKKLWDSSTGTTVPILNKGNLEKISIFLPSLERQCAIVEKLDLAFVEIERIRNQIAVKKDFAGKLRQSLLSDSFSPNLEKESA